MACTKGSWYCLPLLLVHKTVSCTRLFLQLLNSRSYDETSRLEVGNNKRTTARGSSVLFLFFFFQWHIWEAVGIASRFFSYIFLWHQNKITRKRYIEELLQLNDVIVLPDTQEEKARDTDRQSDVQSTLTQTQCAYEASKTVWYTGLFLQP